MKLDGRILNKFNLKPIIFVILCGEAMKSYSATIAMGQQNATAY